MPDDDKLDLLWKKIQQNHGMRERTEVSWSAAARPDDAAEGSNKNEPPLGEIGFVGKNLENGHFAGEDLRNANFSVSNLPRLTAVNESGQYLFSLLTILKNI